MMRRPLWVPLRAVYFDAFVAGTKTTEYRKLGGRLGKLEQLVIGRAVVLSRGYSGPRLQMVIKAVSVVRASTVPDAAAIYGHRARLVAIELSPAPTACTRKSRNCPLSGIKRTSGDGPRHVAS